MVIIILIDNLKYLTLCICLVSSMKIQEVSEKASWCPSKQKPQVDLLFRHLLQMSQITSLTFQCALSTKRRIEAYKETKN